MIRLFSRVGGALAQYAVATVAGSQCAATCGLKNVAPLKYVNGSFSSKKAPGSLFY